MRTRIAVLAASVWVRALCGATGSVEAAAVGARPALDYEIALEVPYKGYAGDFCFVHPRPGIVPRGPDRSPVVVMTTHSLRSPPAEAR